ncbi:MAG: ABC transporter substrate-binding protein [Bacteroidales bacterium]|nr:ABC transporter substrate-binding protein [Bacteroidales bacterium]MDD2323808.1 ABC transporter substrate-binding protein [Bacteroidales bacterium]MDD3011240.1 ABC transporter substrate-binding protein [Bacteroidales bacterium]MDD3962588.1 ABC transporter substrate-binding protein [Bacteroidales bacterium]MDY0286062.1 ABC transporter substrate-binding protein [Bacteroidales bacterium]
MQSKTLALLFLFFPFLTLAQHDTLTFTPHWLPQAQFAGYYMAQKMGFYEQENLVVNIEHPSASINATTKLADHEADVISLFLVTAITARDQGVNLVNIGQTSQQSALLFITKKEHNIKTISDLNGKKIGIWKSGFDEIPKALIDNNNCSVEWVPILSTVNLFLIGGIDAMTVMWYNEYDVIVNSGFDPNELNPVFISDYGYNVPEDGLYCLNETLQTKKETLKRFVKASMKGWDYAALHREETLDTVMALMKRKHIPSNRSHQAWMLDRIIELQVPDEKSTIKGELVEKDYKLTQQILLNGNYIKTKIPFSDFHTPLLLK